MPKLNPRSPKSPQSAVYCIIPAAGSGKRLKTKSPKPLVLIKSKPLLIWTVERILASYHWQKVYLPVAKNMVDAIRALLAKYRITGVEVLEGGRTRALSVRFACERFFSEKKGVVLIHDAARPFIGKNEVRAVLQEALVNGAAILAEKVTSTVKESGPKGRWINRTLDRRRIFLAQTPQGFRLEVLQKAYHKLGKGFENYTDEASMVEAIGRRVYLVEGSRRNLKITTPEDLVTARVWTEKKLDNR